MEVASNEYLLSFFFSCNNHVEFNSVTNSIRGLLFYDKIPATAPLNGHGGARFRRRKIVVVFFGFWFVLLPLTFVNSMPSCHRKFICNYHFV